MMDVTGTGSLARLNKTTLKLTAPTEAQAETTDAVSAAASVQISPEARRAHDNHKLYTNKDLTTGTWHAPGKLTTRNDEGLKQGRRIPLPVSPDSQIAAKPGRAGYPTLMPTDPSGQSSLGDSGPTVGPIILTLPKPTESPIILTLPGGESAPGA